MGNITNSHCKETTYENMDWVWVALLQVLVNTAIKFQFHKRKGISSITERVSDQKLCSLLLATYATLSSTGSRLDVQGIYSQQNSVDTCSGNHPAFYLMGTAGFSSRLKCREPYFSPPLCVDIKIAWSYTSAPPYDIMSWYDTFSSCRYLQRPVQLLYIQYPSLFMVQQLLPASRSKTHTHTHTHTHTRHQAVST